MTTISLVDLGMWERYRPENPPDDAPASAFFARRVTDGVDWYAFARDPATWAADALKATALPTERGLVVMAVARDASTLFPAGCRLFAIHGHDPEDPKPWKSYEQTILDLEAGTFTPLPPPPTVTYKSDIWRRCTDGEAEALDALLARQSKRQQRLFNDATVIAHTDEMFATLQAAVTEALGATRTAEILAPSLG